MAGSSTGLVGLTAGSSAPITLANVLADSQKHLQDLLASLKSDAQEHAKDRTATTHAADKVPSTSTAPLNVVLAAYAVNDPSQAGYDADA